MLSNQRQPAGISKEIQGGMLVSLRTDAAVATVKWPKTLKGASIIFSHTRRSISAVPAPRLSRAARVYAFVKKRKKKVGGLEVEVCLGKKIR